MAAARREDKDAAKAAARQLGPEDLRALIGAKLRAAARSGRRLTLEPSTPRQQAAWEATVRRNLPLPLGDPPALPSPKRPPEQLALFGPGSSPRKGQRARVKAECAKEAREGAAGALLMAKLYARCGQDPRAQDGEDVDRCVAKRLHEKGYEMELAGHTGPDGEVEIIAEGGPCGALHDEAMSAHEAVHARSQKRLARRYGEGTEAFLQAWEDPSAWAKDEVSAYKAEAEVYQDALRGGRNRR